MWVYRLCCTVVAADLHYLSFAKKVDIIYLLCLKNVKQFCLRSALLLFIDPPATSFHVHLTLRPSVPPAPFCSTSEADEEGDVGWVGDWSLVGLSSAKKSSIRGGTLALSSHCRRRHRGFLLQALGCEIRHSSRGWNGAAKLGIKYS